MFDETTTAVKEIPRALESYPSAADQSLAADLAMRVQIEPFNALATGVFLLAILHTFAAARFAVLAHRVQHRHDEEAQTNGRPSSPSLRAELLHFLGEVEVIFGLWAVVLLLATTAYAGWEAARHYVSDTVNYRSRCSSSTSWRSHRRDRSSASQSPLCAASLALVARRPPPGGSRF